MRYAFTIMALTATTTVSAATLSATGDACPGPWEITASGLTDGGQYAMLYSNLGEGSDVIPLGPCAGTTSGLAGTRWAFTSAADDSGSATFNPEVPEGVCGLTLQVLDLSTCEVSNVETFTGDGPEPVLYAAIGQCGSGALDTLDLETGEATTVCALTNGYSGLTQTEDGTLYGIGDSCSGGDLWLIEPDSCTETLVTTDGPGSEMGLSYADGLIYMVDTGSSTATYDVATGTYTDLGFSAVSCCGADIAADADGTMWYANWGSNMGTVDMATGSQTWVWDASGMSKGITWHQGQLIGLNSGCSSVWSYDPVTGVETDTGLSFPDCGYDAIAGLPWVGAGGGAGIHNTIDWSYDGINSAPAGCSYGELQNTYEYLDLGSLTWNECAIAASERGAMHGPDQAYNGDGWFGYRTDADGMIGGWASMTTAGVDEAQRCVLARDPYSDRNTDVLSETVEYDGLTWHYQDLGVLFYDECATAAGNAGATIIPPVSLGLPQSGAYWIKSVHGCNVYGYIDEYGSLLHNNYGWGVQSSAQSCMIGHVE